MKNKRLISLIMSLLLVVTIIVPVAVLAEGTEGVKIVSTTPEDGSNGITPMGVTMEVEFNTAIDPATLTTATISSEPAAIVAVVPDKTQTTKCTVYFSALELNTKYKVMFSKQIKASNGERLQKTEVEFKTSAYYPQHHQIVNGDMENTAHLNMFELANAPKTVISYQEEGNGTVLKFNPGWAGAGVGQYVYIEPGKTYEMRAKIKSTTSQMVRMIMSYVSLSEGTSNWWHPIVSKTLPADQWVEFSGAVTIPDDLSYDSDRLVRITAQNKGQIIYIDDWQFYETGFDIPMPKTSNGGNEGDIPQTFLSAEEPDMAEMEQMVALGIFEAEKLSQADAKVSRIDAAVYMGRIAGVSGMETAKLPTAFADLEGVKKRDAAQALVDMGVMKGYGKYFYPDNIMSVEEALEGAVNLLGYQPMASASGYPAAISKLRLNKGIQKTYGALSYRDFAKILVNALDNDIMNDYAIVQGEKLLWRNLRAKELQGVITATEYTDIYGGSKARKGTVIIDGVSYKVNIDTYGLEGKRVRFLTKEIDSENFILYISEINALNNVLKLEWDDIEDYSKDNYTYADENDRIKKAELAPDKKLIYNGVALSTYPTDELDVDYGNVELIDNDNDDVYDIVRIEEIVTYVVKAVNHDKYTIYNEYFTNNEHKSIDLSSAKNIVVEENGQKVRFSNIVPGIVVSIAESKDKSFAKLYVSNNKLESKVGSVLKDGTETTVILYDNIHGAGASAAVALHPFYNGTKKAREENIFIGQNVSVAIDHMGYAVSITFKDGGNNWQWGYVVDGYLDTERAIDEPELDLKIFDDSGKFSILTCARKVRVNRETVKAEDVLSAMNGQATNALVPQTIQFQKNANDEIVQILSSCDPEKGLKKITGSELTYSSTLNTLGYKVVLSSTSIPVISVPKEITSANEHSFVCSTASEYLINEKEYTFEAYSIDDNELDAEFLVLKDRAVRNTDSWVIGMVMGISESIDDNGEPYSEIIVRNTGANNTAKVKHDVIDINNLNGKDKGTGLRVKKGDIIMYQNTVNATVDNMRLLYSRESKELYTTSNPSSSGNSAHRTVYGTIKKRHGNLISVLPAGESDIEENYEIYNLSVYSRVMVFDSAKNKARVGSAADVLEDKEVVIVSSWGGATLMAVYN